MDTISIHDEENSVQLENHTGYFTADDVERKSGHFYLQQAIEALLPDDAAIITMFYKGEQSLEEIAGVMKMEANTVKVKLHRARQRLKEKIQFILKDEVRDLI